MLRHSFGLAGLALAASAACASASTVTLDFQAFTFDKATTTITAPAGLVNSAVATGEFTFDVTARDGVSVSGEKFTAYCADIYTNLNQVSYTYSYETGVTPFSSLVLGNLERLFTAFYRTIDTKFESAAFQVAIWEIINEPGGAYSLATGDFTAWTRRPEVAVIAQGYLDGLSGAGANKYRLTFYDGHPASGDASQSLLAATAVPLPASLSLVLGGFGALAALRRKRKS